MSDIAVFAGTADEIVEFEQGAGDAVTAVAGQVQLPAPAADRVEIRPLVVGQDVVERRGGCFAQQHRRGVDAVDGALPLRRHAGESREGGEQIHPREEVVADAPGGDFPERRKGRALSARMIFVHSSV